MKTDKQFLELKHRLMEVYDLGMASAVLAWDQYTYMPRGGAVARGRQTALLNRLAHDRFVDAEIGRLLDALQPRAESLPFDSDEASLIRVTRRLYEKEVKVPSQFVADFNQHQAKCYEAWTRARPENNFAAVAPLLEKTLDFSRQYASFFPGYEHIADPLIDSSDPGVKANELRTLFSSLRERLVPLVEAVSARPAPEDQFLFQSFPEPVQEAFGIEVVRQLGYDFNRGRLDRTHHPFTIKFSLGDVRITTRYCETDFRDAFFSTVHEAGHAMYEQGIRPDFEGTPLARGASSGVHESQSRLWENVVGRSREFWEFAFPRLVEKFPDQLRGVSLDGFVRSVNRVKRSLIRVDADELTYNLHIMIRFDLELDLLEGRLAVEDLPEAWRSRYTSDLGVTPPDDRDGVMQDVHWYDGHIGGAFQGYSLGNILSALFYEAALKAHPEIPTQVQTGDFGTLLASLRENIYQHGRKYTANELVQRVTGGPMTIEPYFRYLERKYRGLYGL